MLNSIFIPPYEFKLFIRRYKAFSGLEKKKDHIWHIQTDSNISINCSVADYSSSETSSKKSSIHFRDEVFDQFMLRIHHSNKKDKNGNYQDC